MKKRKVMIDEKMRDGTAYKNKKKGEYTMKFTHLLAAMCCAVSLISCGEEKKERSDLFDNSAPVDLSAILQAYDWYQHYDGDNKDSIMYTKIGPELPEDEFYLFEDTSFVLRVPEYANSKQPFLANAEDFYNSCALSWNVWSNFEVWYRGHTADLLCYDDDVKKSIEALSVNIIKDKEVRKAAQDFEDSFLELIKTEPDGWDEDTNPMDLLISFSDVIESKAYVFYDDKEKFVASLDSVIDIAESMVMDKFQHYLDASEDDQIKVMLGELSTCKNFDEQCSLWRNWANCNKSGYDDEWIVAVGSALMESGNYSPILNRIWTTWRAISQGLHFGSSRDSSIPNNYYNEYRKMCYVSCLKRIEKHPDDIFAMNCAAAIAGRTNMNRFGQNYYGNEAMIECAKMMPKRYHSDDDSDVDSDEE